MKRGPGSWPRPVCFAQNVLPHHGSRCTIVALSFNLKSFLVTRLLEITGSMRRNTHICSFHPAKHENGNSFIEFAHSEVSRSQAQLVDIINMIRLKKPYDRFGGNLSVGASFSVLAKGKSVESSEFEFP